MGHPMVQQQSSVDQVTNEIIKLISTILIVHPKREQIVKNLIEYFEKILSQMGGQDRIPKFTLSHNAIPSQKKYLALRTLQIARDEFPQKQVYFEHLKNLYFDLGLYKKETDIRKLIERYKNSDKLIEYKSDSGYQLGEYGSKVVTELKLEKLNCEDVEKIDKIIMSELSA